MQNGGLRTKGIIKLSKQESPLITVVTVVYNCVETLEQTIQSVINQKYENIEYIIIDGNSSDGTLDVIKKYEDKIDYWQSEPDKGIYDAMNKGIGFANGEWINFMNAGDQFASFTILEELFNGTHYDSSVLYGNTLYKTKFGDIINIPKTTFDNRVIEKPYNHQSCFVKLELHKQNLFFLEYKICADFKFAYDCIVNGVKFQYINKTISIFDGINGVSSNGYRYYLENMKIIGAKNPLFRYYRFIVLCSIKKFIKLFIPNKFLKQITIRKFNQA